MDGIGAKGILKIKEPGRTEPERKIGSTYSAIFQHLVHLVYVSDVAILVKK